MQIQVPSTSRRLSPTERIYPDPDSAQHAFAEERAANPLHRRAPTPYISRSRRGSVSSQRSDRSHRSGVSDRSDRSQPWHPTVNDGESDSTAGPASRNQYTAVGPYEPHFGSARGIGPAGEAIEVIGLGRKEPRHRKYGPHLLKPALRTGPSRERLPQHRVNPRGGQSWDKPLPNRPSSFIVPLDSPGGPAFAHVNQPRSIHSRGSSSASIPTLRSLFSSLSVDPARSGLGRRNSSRRDLMSPADDLFTYLRIVELPPWTAWPGDRDGRRPKSSLGFLSGRGSKGYDKMPWAWHRRMEAAEVGRQAGRSLMSWESAGRPWERRILAWLDDNVPAEPIDPANRWGSQIFALPAPGFDTLEFFDEGADQSDDRGLLSWLTGSVLQTAVSALHMLRYSSQSFTFHMIPSSSPAPYATNTHALWDGFGTLALVNKSSETDRAMIVEVRPPSVCDGSIMREFAKSGRTEGWWHLPGQYCVGESGQANLLQAQVYDSCVQNGVFFFVVTNTKHWALGHFNSTYTKCFVGPVVERKMRDPNVMQCLVAWIVRAIDERPRTGHHSSIHEHRREPDNSRPYDTPQVRHEARSESSHPVHLRSPAFQQADIPVYPDPPASYSQQHPQQYPQQGFDPPTGFPYPSCSPSLASPMGEFGQQYSLPGYYDLHPHMSTSPPPGYGNGLPVPYGTWNGAMGSGFGGGLVASMSQGGSMGGVLPRTFSPVQQGGQGYGGCFQGYGWSGTR